MKYVKKYLLILLLFAIVVIAIDSIRIFTYKTYPAKPEKEFHTAENQLYYALVNDEKPIDWIRLHETLEFIENQYDVSDFKLVNLIRILYKYNELIPYEIHEKIDSTLLGFRYWMDEPGENSMCYWSENHQILFASAEYLIGQFYPDKIFINSGLTGKEHQQKARQQILDWLELRWLYGFTEFYSGTYYAEDVAALLNLIDHAHDEEIVQKSKMILDLLFYDIVTQSFRGMMVSVSGRAYETNRKGGLNEDLSGITRFLLEEKQMPAGMNYALSRTKNYTIPPVLKAIAQDTNTVIIKQSNGLNINELKKDKLYGIDEKNIMMQWGMEAFTNPDIIRNSLKYIKKNNMFSNEFLKDMRYLDFSFMYVFSLQPFLSRKINFPTNGKAIQRSNTYTFRTKDYALYSVQGYHPDDFADQHHVSGMNIGNYFSVFHTHPARKPEDKNHSPNYWVGYGRLPHVAQDENISMSIYNIPQKKNAMEKYILHYTHAYFPKEKFDSVVVSDKYVFGKKDEVYCALIGSGKLQFITSDDLLQKGEKSAWIIEAGSKTTEGSFENFMRCIEKNALSFDKDSLKLSYHSHGKKYVLQFGKLFTINGKEEITEYPRFHSPYVQSPRKPQTISIEFQEKKLFLDFYNSKRAVN